ncbi:4-hydroxybenzoyl-CoA thioesterase [Profundibacterium mesophilum KAUST100406-0324]|uniref:4-hydroxybenzoyl-CoA thioesterase n=1 Tax=Profundibacterium mesophilum KAUST100406-0324 TaxID=1037889 RepID=A0A921NQP4_9RHOB|nr:4-hydroxybenzoyl-CoA thioesterase [Profundibacterium mesophilum KAUST100406-0324]
MRNLVRAAVAAAALLGAPAIAAAQTPVIAALGDSLTQGYGLAPGEGLVPQLREWLAARGADVEIVNAGVSGDTSAGGLSRLDWTLTPEVGGLIVALGGNDLLRGLDPAVTRGNLDQLLERASAREVPILLAGMTAPGNFGARYKADFDAIYPDLAERHGTLLLDDLLAPLTSIADRREALRRYMQPDGVHPNAQGVARIVEALGPAVLELIARMEAAGQSPEAQKPGENATAAPR